MEKWTGYKTWYFEAEKDAGRVTVHQGGETELVICNKHTYQTEIITNL